MPGVRVRLARFRSPWWRRWSMLGVAGGALALVFVALGAWARFAPLPALPEPTPTPVAATPDLRTFERVGSDPRTLAVIAQRNPLSPTRADFVRNVEVVQESRQADTGAADKAKRLENAKAALQTLRLVAILRLRDDWVALFEPAVRKAEDDLLSLRVGDTWQGWTIGAISRGEVRMGFEGHEERVELKPDPKRASAKAAPPRGRIEVEAKPVTKGREVKVDPPLSPSEARERLLGAARDESERVKKLAEDLLKDLEREDE